MKESVFDEVMNLPENPYGKNAYKIQQEAMLRKEMQTEYQSNLDNLIDFSQYTSKCTSFFK